MKDETVNFDKNTGRYQINVEGDNPFQMDKNGAQMKLTYCYYTPGKETYRNLIRFQYTFFSVIKKIYVSIVCSAVITAFLRFRIGKYIKFLFYLRF